MRGFLLSLLALGAVAWAQESRTTYELPGEEVYPEGIAVGTDGSTFFVGSTTDGTIYRGDVQSGEVEVFAEGGQPTAIGMKVDEGGRLWVAGGNSGNVYVYDTVGGELLHTYTTPAADSTFLNDLTIAPDGSVFVTDSMRPVLFRAAPDQEGGELEQWLSFEGTELQYGEGFNLNGIVTTEDGGSLIAVQSNTGQLYRIDLDSQEVSRIELDEPVTNGDGLVLDGDTLYVVRNALGEIAEIALSEDLASGTLQDTITSEDFAFPTTAAIAGDSLLVVNSQFDRRGGSPELPFTVARVPLR